MSETVARLCGAIRESGSPLASSLRDEPDGRTEGEAPDAKPAAPAVPDWGPAAPTVPGGKPTARDAPAAPGGEPAAREAPATELALLAVGGPRVTATRDDVEIAVAAVEEGYRLHYARGRALPIHDPDFALLAGDRMYALGLALLAEIGDLTAIAELADVISLGAQAHASDDTQLAEAAWRAGAAAIATGSSPETEAAKACARAGGQGAAQALHKLAQVRFDTDLS